ncbi:quinone oxidoreductase [Candidatus Pelagibacter sp. IMCC9063]|jgi:NADPH2:quinone reductase|uniref:quinone oxidoreductase family protein n=1 Tax=Pelagibacter sp. (strain IMCC9063) TaxID=1002672 RepID=UPI0002046435|nr:quinone oxidoreductase [Candidatus Pelagibacter sp. IMCC9063]AEA81787.1 quinone oxidoreductase [Candidatus Pelagibacter sp. IMCC9063]
MVKVIKIQKFGGPEELQSVDVELPKLNANEVLIKNLSIGLNYIDVYHRTGLYPIPLPSGIGLEACGMVEEIGSDVTLFKVGDRVAHSSMPIGSYSEKQIFPQEKLVLVPEGISNEVASVIMLKGITAEYLLHRAYPAKKGDKVLFHAAAGGVGQILCQWANAIGCTVIGTVGSKEKEAIAKQNGCHHVINYTDHNFVEEVEKIVGKNGIDVVYDGVGASTFEGSIECLKVRGMMVAFGNASGYVKTLDIKKHINTKGLFFTRPSIAHYTVTRKELEDAAATVFDAILTKKFKVDIFKTYPLSEAKKAHEDLEARKLKGPAVILP